jgi:hypothetical protein
LNAKLRSQEDELYQALKRVVDSPPETDRSAALEQTDPLERKYYDRIGDVNILRERLLNLESEHQRKMFLRSNKAADGAQQNNLGSDAQFFESYISERASLIREYASAKRDVKLLQSNCREAGPAVEEPNFPPEISEDALGRRVCKPSESETIGLTEYIIPSSINGATIKACPDSGSMFDIVSKKLAQENGWTIDTTKSEIITLPSRKRLRSLGTIQADFRFQGEEKSYKRIFHVMDRCIHDVI